MYDELYSLRPYKRMTRAQRIATAEALVDAAVTNCFPLSCRRNTRATWAEPAFRKGKVTKGDCRSMDRALSLKVRKGLLDPNSPDYLAHRVVMGLAYVKQNPTHDNLESLCAWHYRFEAKLHQQRFDNFVAQAAMLAIHECPHRQKER